MKINEITILCSVVDNYGDIGFVYRLSRNLSQKRPELKINIVCSNLKSFAFMNGRIDANKSFQQIANWNVFDWNDEKVCLEYFKQNPPKIILQCFQCERPLWFEDLLFNDDFTREVQIVNIDYLTAEDYAEDFHLLKSGTRKKGIHKINFMPGFTNKTGGLVLDDEFIASRKISHQQKRDLNTFKILLFSYPKNFCDELKAFEEFEKIEKQKNPDFKIKIFLANGLVWQNDDTSIEVQKLGVLEQTDWDNFLCSMDFNFIRGEDSLSRAALSGLPFIWHAYVQDEDYQLVKVDALLKNMQSFFDEKLFSDYKNVMNYYNQTDDSKKNESEKYIRSLVNLLSFAKSSLANSFKNYSNNLISNGNLTDKLLDYLESLTLAN